MAQDEDWRKFINATEEDPDDVETDDPSEDEGDQDPKGGDEDDKNKSKKGAEDEGDEEEDPAKGDPAGADDEEDPPTGDSYKPRLKQFLDKDGKLDVEKIESSYIASGKEAVELNSKLEETNKNYSDLLGVIKSNPAAAELIFGKEGAKKLIADDTITTGANPVAKGQDDLLQNPLIRHLSAQINHKGKSEYNEFVEAHPESVTDPERARKIGIFLKQHGAIYREENDGEIPSMKESLEAAYRYYGWDLELKNKQDVANAVKKSAATRTTPQGKHQVTKKELSNSEQFFASKLGVKLK